MNKAEELGISIELGRRSAGVHCKSQDLWWTKQMNLGSALIRVVKVQASTENLRIGSVMNKAKELDQYSVSLSDVIVDYRAT